MIENHDDEVQYYKREVWAKESDNFLKPHFRMRKVAREVRRITRGRECDLLDVGCGPGTLGSLMPAGVHYYGIDIAVTRPRPNLIERDIVTEPISFLDKKFDVIVAQGLFEYIGNRQSQKFAEIGKLLVTNGKFILTYQNFAHRKAGGYWMYNNVQSPDDFRSDLRRFFRIERSFPVSHNWNHGQPRRRFMKASQAFLNVNVPVLSPILAVDYLYVCAPVRDGAGR